MEGKKEGIKEGRKDKVSVWYDNLCVDPMSANVFCVCMYYLFKLVGYHGEGLEDGVCGSSDSDYPLWTVTLRNVDTGATLEDQHTHIHTHARKYIGCVFTEYAYMQYASF